MEKTLARIFSFLFHPLLVPSYFLLVLFRLPLYQLLGIPAHIKRTVLLFVFILTFVLPSLVAVGMWLFKIIESLEMRRRNERFFPMMIIATFFYVAFYSLKQLPVFQPATLFMLGSTVLVLLGIVLNYFYKISQHMMAWGGFTGALIAFGITSGIPLYFYLFGVIIISGLTGYARLKCKAHTPFEVYSGWLLGVGVMSTLFFLL
ncbi:hypothetical protein LA303_02610 [Candidatus Sulfidibacterium hydrothermale]|uniref:hypothetical protein n=1 Tax=Candidatus Sulfidibacterium hydrothermale TaxID=2875962 RepID=UPI001F0A74A6|nr:hypothetical protein [Candidatus Sulfidibacterium hydrothermale]UBM62880.1 hypothetical protein LA303_02610 [Candidatus Sulfidibacterium hydrothermale]